MKILLLEDDPQTAAFIRKGLEQAGFTVAHSGDGLAGLIMAQEEEFDLAVVDVMLPRLDGFGVVRKLRATTERPGHHPQRARCGRGPGKGTRERQRRLCDQTLCIRRAPGPDSCAAAARHGGGGADRADLRRPDA